MLVALGVALLLWWMDGGPAGDVAVSPEGPVADGVVAEGREAPGLPGAVQPPVAIPLFCFKEVSQNHPWTGPVQVILLSAVEEKRPHFELDPNLPTLQPDENGFVFAADLESALSGSDLAAAAVSEFLFLPVGAFPTPCPALPDSPQVTREVLVVPFASLSGRVVDKRGQPFAGALVDIETDRRFLAQFLREKNWPGLIAAPVKVQTDADGRFATSGLFPGSVTTARVRHIDAIDLVETLTLVPGENQIELVMAVVASIRIAFSDAGFPADSEEQIQVGLNRYGRLQSSAGFTPLDPIAWTLVKPGEEFVFGPLEEGNYEIDYRSRREGEPVGFIGLFIVDQLAGGERRDLGTVDVLGGKAVEVCVINDSTSEPMSGVTVEISGETQNTPAHPAVELVTAENGCVTVIDRTDLFRIALRTPPNTRYVGPPAVQYNKGEVSRHEFRLEPWFVKKRTIEIVGPPHLHDPEFLELIENREVSGVHASVRTFGLARDGTLRMAPNLGFPSPSTYRWDDPRWEWMDTLVVGLSFVPKMDCYWGYAYFDRDAENIRIDVKPSGRLIGQVVGKDGTPSLEASDWTILNHGDSQKLAQKINAGADFITLYQEVISPCPLALSGSFSPGQFDISFVPPVGHLDLWIGYMDESGSDGAPSYHYVHAGTFRDLGSRTLDLGTIVVGE